jgi:hypothetical protein
MTPLEWVLAVVAGISLVALLFSRGARRHWPIVVFIGVLAALGVLVSVWGVDPRECQRVGLDCLR